MVDLQTLPAIKAALAALGSRFLTVVYATGHALPPQPWDGRTPVTFPLPQTGAIVAGRLLDAHGHVLKEAAWPAIHVRAGDELVVHPELGTDVVWVDR